MTNIELKKQLIDKIQKTENTDILEEVFRILDLEAQDIDIYKLNEEQKSAIAEARQQLKNGQFLTEDQANQEIDEWLKK